MTVPQGPPWSTDQLEADRQVALGRFREERMREPLEDYLEAFDRYRSVVEDLLEMTVDLSIIGDVAVEVLSEPSLLDAVRYLAGPPISRDDLQVLTEASLSPGQIRRDPLLARKIVDTVLLGLDRNRFPWVTENREPTDVERSAAAMASAVLIASSRVMTNRRTESNVAQEAAVRDAEPPRVL